MTTNSIGEKQFERDFQDSLDGWVLSAVGRGITSFCDVVMELPSVYPATALDSLLRLASAGRIPASLAERMRREASAPRPLCGQEHDIAANNPPHPLDFEWRFERESSERLLATAAAECRQGDSVLLLGTPSLYRSGLRSARTGLRVALVDANREALAELNQLNGAGSVFACTIGEDELPDLAARAVIMDPPWYPDVTEAFLRAAARLSLPGAQIFACMPPVGTRPGIEEEGDRLVRSAEEAGLQLLSAEQMIRYESPFFEWNALRAGGVLNYPCLWRRGSVLRFTVATQTRTSTYVPGGRLSERWWTENVSGVTMKLRPTNDRSFADPRLVPLVSGEIMPTVSRRAAPRSSAHVWTTGNRAYRCAGTFVLREIIRANRAKSPIVQQVERALHRKISVPESELVRQATEQVREMVRVESAELADYSAWASCRYVAGRESPEPQSASAAVRRDHA